MAEIAVYEILRTFPYHTEFLAEYHGETRRCQKMEHVNIGSGWLLQVEGVKGIVSDSEITNPRPLGGNKET